MSYTDNYLNLGTIRAATLPTTSYVYASIDLTKNGSINQTAATFNTLVLDVTMVKQSATSFELLVEGSTDNVNFFPYTVGTFASSIDSIEKDVITFTCSKYAATDYASVPVQINHPYLRVGVKGTGTLTDTSVTVKAQLYNK